MIKRYKHIIGIHHYPDQNVTLPTHTQIESDEGDWVKYSDYVELAKNLQNTGIALAAEVADLKSQLDHCTKQNEHTELVAKEEIERLRAELAAMTEQLGRLRSHNDQLKKWLYFTRDVIADYQTPNVDNVTIKEIEK
jgi:chromatin segregation and condensation protein Rec8/ScpA/Scc1 (kleisin family)